MNWIVAIGCVLGAWTLLRLLADERSSQFERIVEKLHRENPKSKTGQVPVAEEVYTVK